MTTLLIQTEGTPLTVNLLAIAPMTKQQFYEFCLAIRYAKRLSVPKLHLNKKMSSIPHDLK
ncbi:hypothetical protein ACQ4M4_26135 [Leptolyngbya sp. AN02str]|uniref:hypothetical protein n=1 Tax=Leptolyngbya sp. AN02str TaxID=3423363 RepID=UPI003D315D4C